MKKIITMALCLGLALSVIGCENGGKLDHTANGTDMPIVNDDVNTAELQVVLNESETNAELANIVDLTVVNQLSTDDVLEEFYKDNNYTYYFPSIKSEYIECQFTNGDKMTIVEALNRGKVSISDLDTYNIFYWMVDKNGNYIKSSDIREDVCELYLEVLEDLWNVDSGLNSEISLIGIDLSELSHLTEEEKEKVMNDFASSHNLPYIEGTWEELCEQGYIDKDNLCWENGLFFSIKTNEDAVWNLPAIKEGDLIPELTSFDAQKWRSGLGAYFFGQCTAQKKEDGTWSYTVGQEAIS